MAQRIVAVAALEPVGLRLSLELVLRDQILLPLNLKQPYDPRLILHLEPFR